MDILKLVLQIVLILISFLLVVLVLLHKGRGGGMSDMFGGGVSSSLGSSGVAERNLTRLTVTLGVLWGGIIVALGLIMRFSGDF
ncbi:MAG: preprotein translocase subunit SecG [Micrococcaceae bacterium]